MNEQRMTEPEQTLSRSPETAYDPVPGLQPSNVEAFKFWLMPFVCFLCFGFPTRYGTVVSSLSGFAPLCFFLLCGYFALPEDPEEASAALLKGIRRYGLFFATLATVCLCINLCYFLFIGADAAALLTQLLRKRTLFYFFVLCAWPFQMGESVWFIQSLFYSCVGLFLLNKFRLLRNRKFYLTLLLLCGILMLLSGELAGVIHFSVLGCPYLPPSALTRALPYLLLGGLIRRGRAALRKPGPVLYWALVPLGLVLAFLEFDVLSRLGLLRTTSHAVGLGITAFGLSVHVLLFGTPRPGMPAFWGRRFARWIYAISQPVAFLLIVPLSFFFPSAAAVVQMLGGAAVYPVCFGLVLAVDYLCALNGRGFEPL